MAEPTLGVDCLTPAIGALITGVDVGRECSATLLDRLYALLLEHRVLFLPAQTLTPATLLAFAATFGELDTPHHVYPHVPGYERVVLLENDGARPPNTDVWHTDLTFKPSPDSAGEPLTQRRPTPQRGRCRVSWAGDG
jgi:taurine dioxygenase